MSSLSSISPGAYAVPTPCRVLPQGDRTHTVGLWVPLSSVVQWCPTLPLGVIIYLQVGQKPCLLEAWQRLGQFYVEN